MGSDQINETINTDTVQLANNKFLKNGVDQNILMWIRLK